MSTDAAVKIGVLGAQGRMGKMIEQLLSDEYQGKAVLFATVSRGEALDPLLTCNVVIDFALPDPCCKFVRAAAGKPVPLVSGSTGWTADQNTERLKYSKLTPVLAATNFSTGVFALRKILRQAGPLLDQLGYEPVLTESHHVHKKDAPSGTATSIQSDLRPNAPASLQTHAIRSGEVIGDHEVTFYGKADQITIGHHAQNRSIFARGAIDAAIWLTGKIATGSIKNGWLEMEDYFNDLSGKVGTSK